MHHEAGHSLGFEHEHMRSDLVKKIDRDSGLKSRDIVGYSMLQFVVHVPVVLLLVWLLNYML